MFFSFIFPLREYFFCTSPAPPPHKFSNGPSLTKRAKKSQISYGKVADFLRFKSQITLGCRGFSCAVSGFGYVLVNNEGVADEASRRMSHARKNLL